LSRTAQQPHTQRHKNITSSLALEFSGLCKPVNGLANMEEFATNNKRKIEDHIKVLQDILTKFKKETQQDISGRAQNIEERFAAVERRLDHFEKSLNKLTIDLNNLQTGKLSGIATHFF
jgi:chromosome segregation ATPase